MPVVELLRASLARRGWPIGGDPVWILLYVYAVDSVAVGWSLYALAHLGGAGNGESGHRYAVFVLLAALAVAFEECARQIGRLQFRVSRELKRDMTSVWSVAAAVALSAGLAVILHVVVLGYLWFRQQRPAGEIFYRKFCSSCAALIGCLVAGAVFRSFRHVWAEAPLMLGGAISVLVVIAVHSVTNRALITGALLCLGARGARLVGTAEDNLLELATLCMGGLVAVSAIHETWLCVLVFPPMLALQRGAFIRDLDAAATTDPKTGLLNATTWDHIAQRELARGRRDGTPVAVLIVDIDRFKLVNDRYGHLAGDVVLREVGRCLREAVREYDTVARFGGEEFVAVLPAADDSVALVVAERLRALVNRLHVTHIVGPSEQLGGAVGDPGLPGATADDRLAVSVGVAVAPSDGDELAEVLHAADGALYRAKAAGRNRVLLADRPDGTTPLRRLQA